MKDFFKLKENNTTVYTEIIAGITTFFTMAYIIFVNPAILSLNPGMPWFGIFAATILASAFGTIFMALFANVPFALAPGMGANAFFTFVICKQMGFSWQEALFIVTICGFFIILITVTELRKMIVKAIPDFLKDSISGGIGLFIAYIGFKNASFLKFLSDSGNYSLLDNGSIIANSAVVPSLASFNNPHALLGLIGLIIMSLLVIKKVRGSIFIGIVATILIGIPMEIVDLSNVKLFDFYSLSALKDVAFAAFSQEGIGNLFSDWNKIILTITAILALLLSVTFDAIGTFIGAGRVSGIFDTEEEKSLANKKGINSKFEKALFSDGIAAAFSGLFGTSSVTTYVESAAGISVGGRTGLTSLVVAILFLLCLPFASLFSIVPSEATAPALIIVGVLMMSSVMNINWSNLEQAIPAFLTISIMAFAFNISYGIAAGFIFHCIIKLFQGKIKEVHPILSGTAILFLINFVIIAIRG
ncbi:NCS2 family permease [Candidatus Endomicrobiellum devescovinae]|jgi:AGZA family xanthine/uracil permease-like MFS transporter|uniref:NCS2 family permease n=1 Tax=Candidatus Endomicrobiellum devescovinae TaxID=3242322 RepID=UPI0028208778|nr:NCS2 family permease [Endomicrobium sp.]